MTRNSSNQFKYFRETWTLLKAAIRNTLKAKEPQHPAVITAWVPPILSIDFGNCLKEKIGNAVNKAVNPLLSRNKGSISVPNIKNIE